MTEKLFKVRDKERGSLGSGLSCVSVRRRGTPGESDWSITQKAESVGVAILRGVVWDETAAVAIAIHVVCASLWRQTNKRWSLPLS